MVNHRIQFSGYLTNIPAFMSTTASTEQDWPFLATVHVVYGSKSEISTVSRKIRIFRFCIFMSKKFHVFVTKNFQLNNVEIIFGRSIVAWLYSSLRLIDQS